MCFIHCFCFFSTNFLRGQWSWRRHSNANVGVEKWHFAKLVHVRRVQELIIIYVLEIFIILIIYWNANYNGQTQQATSKFCNETHIQKNKHSTVNDQYSASLGRGSVQPTQQMMHESYHGREKKLENMELLCSCFGCSCTIFCKLFLALLLVIIKHWCVVVVNFWKLE